MERLRDQIWQFISVVITVVGLLLNAFAISDTPLRLLSIAVVFIIAGAILVLSRTIKTEQDQITSLSSIKSSNTIPPLTPLPSVNNNITMSIPSSIAISSPSPLIQQIKGDLIKGGHLHFRSRKYPEALTAYRQAQALDPDDPRIYSYQGFVYYEQKQYKKALTAYEEAISHDGYDALTYYHQAMALESLGRHKDAIRAYRLGNGNGISIDCNGFINDRIKLHYNTKLINLYFMANRLSLWAFVLGIIVLFIASSFNIPNNPESLGSVIFTIIFISEILIALVIWAFLSIIRMLLGIETSSNTSKSTQSQARPTQKNK